MTRELIGDVLVALSFAVGGLTALVAAVEDARTGRLRNVLTATIAAVGVVGLGIAAIVTGDGVRALGSVVGAVLFAGPWFVMHLIRPKEIGFGDVKLTAGLGLYLGWISPALSPVAVLMATAVFVAASVATRASRREARPFGPALVTGAFVAALLGVAVIT